MYKYWFDYSSTHDNLPLYVRDVGTHDAEPGVCHPEGYLPNYHILVSMSGCGMLVWQGRQYVLSPGTVVFSYPSDGLIYAATTESWATGWITFDGALCSHILANIPAGVYRAKDENICAAIKEIRDLPVEGRCENAAALLYRLLLWLPQKLLPYSLPIMPVPAVGVYAAREAILTRFSEHGLSVDKLAAIAKMPRRTFERKFRETFGRSPMADLNHHRISVAHDYAKYYQDLSLGEVAKLVGMRDLTALNRLCTAMKCKKPAMSRRFSKTQYAYHGRADTDDVRIQVRGTDASSEMTGSVLPLRLLFAGHGRKEQLQQYANASCYRILLCMEGNLTVRISMVKYPVSQHTLVFLQPGTPLQMEEKPDTDATYFFLGFTTDFCHSFFPVCEGVFRIGPWDEKLQDYAHLLEDAVGKEGTVASSALYRFLIALNNRIKAGISRINDTYDPRILPALAYIDEDCSRNISLDDLAKKCGLSSTHFCRLFRKVMNRPPLTYLAEKRMEYAAELLLSHPEYSETKIAYLSGYTSFGYFLRRFKWHYAMLPSEYRTRHRNKPSEE